MSVRVLIADDHPVTRLGVAALVRGASQLELVAECASGAEVLPACRRTEPHVALVDLRLPDIDGWEVIAQLSRELPIVRVIAISALDGPDATRRAIEAGARAFVHKGTPPETLLKTIRDVAKSVSPLPATRALLASLPQSEPLTGRERDVLRLIVEGHTNQQIADALGIGVGTVRTHVANVLAKLGVDHRTEAAIAAVRRGLL